MTLSWFKLHWMMSYGKFYLVNSEWNADSILTSIVSDTCHRADDMESSRISPNLMPQQLRTNFMSTGLVAWFFWVHSICSKVNQTRLVMLPVVAVFSFEVKRYKHCSVIPCAGSQEVFFFHGTHWCKQDQIFCYMDLHDVSGQVAKLKVHFNGDVKWPSIWKSLWLPMSSGYQTLIHFCIACAKWPRPGSCLCNTSWIIPIHTRSTMDWHCAAICLAVTEPSRCRRTRDLLAFLSKPGT